MARRFQTPAVVRLKDEDAERVRRSHAGCLHELQSVPIVGGHIVRDIELPDGQDVYIPHGLGRRATAFLSPARTTVSATTGRIREFRGSTVDPDKFVLLKAQGWGETIYVDAWIF